MSDCFIKFLNPVIGIAATMCECVFSFLLIPPSASGAFVEVKAHVMARRLLHSVRISKPPSNGEPEPGFDEVSYQYRSI